NLLRVRRRLAAACPAPDRLYCRGRYRQRRGCPRPRSPPDHRMTNGGHSSRNHLSTHGQIQLIRRVEERRGEIQVTDQYGAILLFRLQKIDEREATALVGERHRVSDPADLSKVAIPVGS